MLTSLGPRLVTSIRVQQLFVISRQKQTKSLIDKSKIPVLNEEDLEEHFIKGFGPGGSRINKKVSCVCLKHIPTGFVIKCQDSRLLQENQKIARERLIEKLDVFYNGEMSIKAQRERLLEKKSKKLEQKSKNLMNLKKNYKDHLSKISNNTIVEEISNSVEDSSDRSN